MPWLTHEFVWGVNRMAREKFKILLKEKPTYLVALCLLILLVGLALIAPLLPMDPTRIDVSQLQEAPSLSHWFGTDEVGRDYLIRVLYGGRVSLFVGFLAMLVSLGVGTVIGLLSGYFGGWVDTFFMRLVDVISAIPWLVLAIVFTVFFKPGMTTIIMIIGFFSWMPIARLVRAETLAVRERHYVKYAQFIGVGPLRLIGRHILTSIVPTIMVASTSSIAGAIMTESTLSFLGLGIQPPQASWGNLLQTAQSNLQAAPHMALIPGALIMLTIFAFNEVGNLIRDLTQREV